MSEPTRDPSLNDPLHSDPTPMPRRRIWPWFVIPSVALVAFLLTSRIVNEPRGKEGSPMRVPVPAVMPEDQRDTKLMLPVEEGDRHLRETGAKWSTDPLYERWLTMLSLRHLVAAAQLVADGESPRSALPFLAIPGAFKASEDDRFIAPESYARYDVIARVAGAIDAAAAGDAYSKFRPFLDSAFSEIGRPGKAIDEVLSSAVMRVVNVKFPEGEVELVPKGAVYAFKDPALEGLSAAEKQVLRMGSKNGSVLQNQLRVFAEHAKLASKNVR